MADLVLWKICEILAVKMSRKNQSPRRIWVLGRNYIGEFLFAVWSHVSECILLDMPVESAKSGDYVILHERAVCCVGCKTICVNPIAPARWLESTYRLVESISWTDENLGL
jgi:hypothetical protein